jgi:hypothetical protein
MLFTTFSCYLLLSAAVGCLLLFAAVSWGAKVDATARSTLAFEYVPQPFLLKKNLPRGRQEMTEALCLDLFLRWRHWLVSDFKKAVPYFFSKAPPLEKNLPRGRQEMTEALCLDLLPSASGGPWLRAARLKIS